MRYRGAGRARFVALSHLLAVQIKKRRINTSIIIIMNKNMVKYIFKFMFKSPMRAGQYSPLHQAVSLKSPQKLQRL
jgi:hypothetical protein